jgi:hypothetical protein
LEALFVVRSSKPISKGRHIDVQNRSLGVTEMPAKLLFLSRGCAVVLRNCGVVAQEGKKDSVAKKSGATRAALD